MPLLVEPEEETVEWWKISETEYLGEGMVAAVYNSAVYSSRKPSNRGRGRWRRSGRDEETGETPGGSGSEGAASRKWRIGPETQNDTDEDDTDEDQLSQ